MPGLSSPPPPQPFRCPTCGASLPIPDDAPSVRCEYCGSNVLVPPECRWQKQPEMDATQQPLVIQISGSDELQPTCLCEATQRNT